MQRLLPEKDISSQPFSSKTSREKPQEVYSLDSIADRSVKSSNKGMTYETKRRSGTNNSNEWADTGISRGDLRGRETSVKSRQSGLAGEDSESKPVRGKQNASPFCVIREEYKK